MNAKSLVSAVLLSGMASLFPACGDGDGTEIAICSAGQVTCLTDHSGEVCNTDGTAYVPFSCAAGEACGAREAGEAGAASAYDGEPGCRGACRPGATECGSESVSRVCAGDGKSWIPVPCTPGTGCDDEDPASATYGTCIRVEGDEPSVTVCDAGEVTCADATTVKSCERDRSGWRYAACAENERCEETDEGAACRVDPKKGCVPHSGTCVNREQVRRCNDEGTAYELVEDCPDGTTCFDGGCQGPVCTVGAVRCSDVALGNGDALDMLLNASVDPQTRYRCNADGSAWVLESCPGNAICVYDNVSNAAVNAFVEDTRSAYLSGQPAPVFTLPPSSRGTCQVPECVVPFALRDLYELSERSAGSFTCGDPNDPDAEFLESFSLCEGLAPYSLPHWANYACPEHTECTYTENRTGGATGGLIRPSCEGQCHPGAIACYTDVPNGEAGSPIDNPGPSIGNYGEYTIACQEDGTWDPASIERCRSDDGRELWCGPSLQGGADRYDIGTCMEPACIYWFETYGTFQLPPDVGACGRDGSFRRCRADGTFGEAEDCALCVELTSAPNGIYAGYTPGECSECVNGEQHCLTDLDDAGNGSPFYVICNEGGFELDSCDGGEFCRGYVDLEDPRDLEGYGLPKILCGGECRPFTAQCVTEDGAPGGTWIQTCNEHGELEGPEPCPGGGACHDDEQGNPNEGTAHCETECIEGTRLCVSATLVATCDDGRYDLERLETCSGGEICVDRLGCRECVPNSVVCESATEIKGCNQRGEFEPPVTCPGETPTCVPESPAYCLAPTAGSGGSSGAGGTAGAAGGAGAASGSGGGGQGGSAGVAGMGSGTGGDLGAGGDVTDQQ